MPSSTLAVAPASVSNESTAPVRRLNVTLPTWPYAWPSSVMTGRPSHSTQESQSTPSALHAARSVASGTSRITMRPSTKSYPSMDTNLSLRRNIHSRSGRFTMKPIQRFSLGWNTKRRTLPMRFCPFLPPKTRTPVSSLVVMSVLAIVPSPQPSGTPFGRAPRLQPLLGRLSQIAQSGARSGRVRPY